MAVGERARFALYAAHLLTDWAISLSDSLLAVAVIAQMAVGRAAWSVPPKARPPLRLAGVYLLLLMAAVAASENPLGSLHALTEIFSFATFGLALVLARGEPRVRWLVDTLILVATGVAVWGLMQLLQGYGELEHRIRGPFSHYMTFAGFLLVVDMFLVARMLVRRPPEEGSSPSALLDRSWVSWICLVTISVALVGSLTRSAMVALVIALVVLVTASRPRLLLLAPVVVAAGLVITPVPVVARVLSIGDLSDVSNYDRLCMAEAGFRMIGERPLLGLGPDQVKELYPLYRHPTAPRLLVPHLHDAYLEMAAERGIPELAVFLALIGSALLAAGRGYRRGGPAADLYLGVVGALVGFAIAALFEDNWGDTEVKRVVMLTLAIPFCLGATDEASDAEPPGEGEAVEEAPAGSVAG